MTHLNINLRSAKCLTHSRQLPHVLCGVGVSAVKGSLQRALSPIFARRLCHANKPETTAHGCHCPGDMDVRLPDCDLVFEYVTSFYCLKEDTFLVIYVKCVPIPIKKKRG